MEHGVTLPRPWHVPGKVVTAAGVSAGIDVALHLVARLDSHERAEEVRRYLRYETPVAALS